MEVIHYVLMSPTANVLMTTTKQVQMRYLRSMFDVFWVWNRASRYIYIHVTSFVSMWWRSIHVKTKVVAFSHSLLEIKLFFADASNQNIDSYLKWTLIKSIICLIAYLVISSYQNSSTVYSSNFLKIGNKIPNSFHASITPLCTKYL